MKISQLFKTVFLVGLSHQTLLAGTITQAGDDVTIKIDDSSFKYEILSSTGKKLLKPSAKQGITINKKPVNSVKKHPSKENNYIVSTSAGVSATVQMTTIPNGVKITASSNTKKELDFSFSAGGMSPAYGLADHGGWLSNADISKSGKAHTLKNNGGSHRFISSFVVFPKDRAAGVIFSRKPMRVFINKDTYNMATGNVASTTCYYFYGELKDIYASYQKVRHAEGFADVEPKAKLFELGWESWDALGWQTNEKSVKDYLSKFTKAGYPVRWAVTGSGFWKEGGSTTSFAIWDHKKYRSPQSFRKWMHGKDISWMIGQRTNFVALGGPHTPKGRRDGNASMSKISSGPFTKEGLSKDYFYNGEKTYRSGIYPLAPLHILDSNKPGAADWYAKLFAKWNVDGIKEDTMVSLSDSTLFNKAIAKLSDNKGLIMARCAAYSSPGTLMRINDTHGNGAMSLRAPVNYLQYAASGAPNVYSDTVGFHSMGKYSISNIRNAWFQSLTAGMAVGKGPFSWKKEQQAEFKKAVDFHYAIGPYLYSAAMDSYQTGYPYTMIPLHIAYPDDANVYQLASKEKRQFQWMVGESILATPILHSLHADKTKHNIYLPEGRWMDYESGKIFEGPLSLDNYSMPVTKTPCFIGGKGIIVLRENEKSPLVAQVFPVSPAGTVYKFHHAKGKASSTILNEVTQWDSHKFTVINKESKKTIPHKINKQTGAITFTIAPGQNYLVK